MAIAGIQRCAAFEVNAAGTGLEIQPAGLMHYQAGPVIYRQFWQDNRAWLAVFEAQHDGVGWLVIRTYVRPMILMEGDYAHFRGRIVEDRGPLVVARFEDRRDPVERPLPRSAIVFMEEREPRPITNP